MVRKGILVARVHWRVQVAAYFDNCWPIWAA